MNILINKLSDAFSNWIGSTTSLIFHTCFFLACFLSPLLLHTSYDSMLLILTTVVSLEAIYLAIFIQRSVIQQGERLEDVEESIDDVEEALDDVEEALDDVEEGLDDVEKNTKVTNDLTRDELRAIITELKEVIASTRK